MSEIDFDARLDGEHIRAAAWWAAQQLAADGFARVQLTPGDLTAYDVVVVAPCPRWENGRTQRSDPYMVVLTNSFGAAYQWHAEPLVAGYVGAKWTNSSVAAGPRLWTGEVLSRFLNALAEAIGEAG